MTSKSQVLSKYLAKLGKRGGKARAEKLDPEERRLSARKAGIASGKARSKSLTEQARKEIAQKAAKARWAKKK